MAEKEVDIIAHLLDIERAAAEILAHAQEEAEKRISAAKLQADRNFKAQYDQIVAAEEKRLADEIDAVAKRYDEDIAAYKERLSAAKKDTTSFNNLLEKVLLGN